ncbi:MAG: PAS domain-containing protein [Scytonema sp. PMC 1069.18]|nr:PAS domain-containing protein [Scytonema sp. PMC 1069.18]MEC4882382.1 PAS domain-containing protein [Scytonema sp. PMC 1070.18]
MCNAKELTKLNQQLTLALEATNMGIWDWDLLTNQVVWSGSHERLFGLSPGTFPGTYEAVIACIHPNDREMVVLALNHARIEQHDFHQEFRVVWSDGSIHWMESKGRCFYNNEAQAIRMLGTVMEISDRKQIEIALKDTQKQFLLLAENIQDMLWISNPLKSKVLYVSPAYEYIWGRNKESLYANSREWVDAIHPEDRNYVEAVYYENIMKGKLDEEYRIVRPDGEMRWIRDRGFAIKNEDGEVECVIGIAQDITKSKQVEDTLKQLNEELEVRVQQRTLEISKLYKQLEEELHERQRVEVALRRSEAQFRSLCEFAPIGIFKADAQGRNIYSNPRCQAICGCTFEKGLGDWKDFVHPDDIQMMMAEWNASIAAKQEYYSEVRFVNSHQNIRFCRVKSAPLLSDTEELIGHVGIVEDITEKRAIEEMKNEFISIVSHELRTPLASIRGSLGLLAAGTLDDQPEMVKQMLDIAVSDTDRLVRLVNDILDLERLEANNIILDKRWCDTSDLMEKSVEALQPLAAQNSVMLSIIPTSLQVMADPDRIVQTLINLISNAIKFSPSTSTITLIAEDLSDSILFKVQDQGRGIPDDKLEAIFGRFQQVYVDDFRQKGGTGLGLAICRSIIHQHGGRIWVESVLGKGSVFYFTLPKSVHP